MPVCTDMKKGAFFVYLRIMCNFMGMKKLLAIFFFSILLFSCFNNEPIHIKGRFFATYHPDRNIYSLKDGINNTIYDKEYGDTVYYHIISFYHNTNNLIALKTIHTKDNSRDKKQFQYCQILKIDTNQNILDTIYQGNDDEHIFNVRLSQNDSLIFFTTVKASKMNISLSSESYKFCILNINNDTITLRKKVPFNDAVYVEFSNNPWSYNNKYLTFHLGGENFITYEEFVEKQNSKEKSNIAGVYIYDIKNDKFKFIAQGGAPSFSPTKNIIAYNYDEKTNLFDLNNGNQTTIYKTKIYEFLGSLEWSPDGNYVLIRCRGEQFMIMPIRKSKLRLIDITSIEEVEYFPKLSCYSNNIIWLK